MRGRPASPSTVTIQILNHANGGESCGLYSPAGSDRPGSQIMPESDIDPSNKAPQTSRNPIPAGAKFIVWCKRKADSGNADISGYVYYR